MGGVLSSQQLTWYQRLTNTPVTIIRPTLLQNPGLVADDANRELLSGRTFFDYQRVCEHILRRAPIDELFGAALQLKKRLGLGGFAAPLAAAPSSR